MTLQYDAAGNVTGDGSQLTYDATGQQVRALYAPAGGWDIQQGYDGDRLRVKKTENGAVTYYLRSSILGGQVVAEFNQTGTWLRGYVYDGGGQLLALQAGGVRWVHQDPVTKSQRVTNKWGTTLETIDLDPWGGETTRTQSTGVQPRKYTTYDRDANGRDQAMMRSYHGWFSRFDQPDPSDASYDLADTQSLNRYAYVNNDPVNFVDPAGLDKSGIEIGAGLKAINEFVNVNVAFRLIGGAGKDEGSVLDEILTTDVPGDAQQTAPSLSDAINAARNALKDPNGDCAKLFAKGNGLDKLNELEKKGRIKIGDTKIPKHLGTTGKLVDAPGIAGLAKDGKIFLNPSSSVVKGTGNPRAAVFGGMSSIDALATLIIHELLHVTKDRPPEAGENYRRDSLLNSQDVKSACFSKY